MGIIYSFFFNYSKIYQRIKQILSFIEESKKINIKIDEFEQKFLEQNKEFLNTKKQIELLKKQIYDYECEQELLKTYCQNMETELFNINKLFF